MWLKAERLIVSRVSFVSHGGDVDGAPLAGSAVPDLDELVRCLDHDVVVAAHRGLGEGGHEEVVGEAPVGLVGVGGEEPVLDEHPQVLDARCQRLGEAAVVAQLPGEVDARDEDELPTEGDHLEDRPEVPTGTEHVLHRREGVRALGEGVPEPATSAWRVREGLP